MPFKKGQKANPRGPMVGAGIVRAECMRDWDETIKTLRHWRDNGTPEVSVKACKELLDRAIGKAKESLEVGGSDGSAGIVIKVVDAGNRS